MEGPGRTKVDVLEGAKRILAEHGRVTNALKDAQGRHCMYGAMLVAGGVPIIWHSPTREYLREETTEEIFNLVQETAALFMKVNKIDSLILWNDELPPSAVNDAKVLAALDRTIASAEWELRHG